MTFPAMLLVPRLCEIAFYPLHYLRQSAAFARLYQEMDVIPHNAEIPQAEMESPPRLCDERKEEHLEPRLKKAHAVMVNFRRDMVRRSVAERSQASHTYNNGIVMRIDFSVRRRLAKNAEKFWCQTPRLMVKFSLKVLSENENLSFVIITVLTPIPSSAFEQRETLWISEILQVSLIAQLDAPPPRSRTTSPGAVRGGLSA
jgi:hypothetical protein